MVDEVIIDQDFVKFETTATNFVQFTKGIPNGILTYTSYDDGSTGGNVLLKGIIDPVDAQDVATKAYVDAQTGSVPGGSTGSIQFNNTTFLGTTEFLYDGIRTITIGSQATTAIIQAPIAISTTSAGGSLSIVSGAGGSSSGDGGDILITAGITTSGTDGKITLNTNGANNLVINNTSVTYLLPTYEQDGSAAAPSYSFTTDPDTGIFNDGNGFCISYGGSRKAKFSDGVTILDQQLNTHVGSVSNPSYAFANDANTGMYRPAADQIGFSAGGVKMVGISPISGNVAGIGYWWTHFV
jgi:hypothetical protein